MYRILIAITYLIFSPFAFAEAPSCDKHNCIMVIDAGSTGSRAHIYSYDYDETHTPINIEQVWTNKVKPGFAAIETKNISEYLTNLLGNAPSVNAPVYFYATAGMRLLPYPKQKIHYKELQQWFAQQSKWQLIASRTIAGKEEALFDWLAVNYTLGTLKANSVGVMDMGGVSVQIAFPIINKEAIDRGMQTEVTIYGQHINLFISSFLGLGQNQVSYQFLNYATCFANDYPLPNGQTGKGDFLGCAQKINTLINGVHNVSSTIQPALSSNPVNAWYAIGGITNLADQSLFSFQKNQFTGEDLIQQGDNQVCHQSWDKLTNQFPDDEYIYGYCLFSAYFYSLLIDGYGFAPNQTINYIPAKDNLDWTKGVVLHH